MQHVFGPSVDTDILDCQRTKLDLLVVLAEQCERSNLARLWRIERLPEFDNFWPLADQKTIRIREQTFFHCESGNFFRLHIEHGYCATHFSLTTIDSVEIIIIQKSKIKISNNSY